MSIVTTKAFSSSFPMRQSPESPRRRGSTTNGTFANVRPPSSSRVTLCAGRPPSRALKMGSPIPPSRSAIGRPRTPVSAPVSISARQRCSPSSVIGTNTIAPVTPGGGRSGRGGGGRAGRARRGARGLGAPAAGRAGARKGRAGAPGARLRPDAQPPGDADVNQAGRGPSVESKPERLRPVDPRLHQQRRRPVLNRHAPERPDLRLRRRKTKKREGEQPVTPRPHHALHYPTFSTRKATRLRGRNSTTTDSPSAGLYTPPPRDNSFPAMRM